MFEKPLELKFKDREAFGNFCVALKQDRIPFILRGSLTIGLDEAAFERLSPTSTSRVTLDKYKGANAFQDVGTVTRGRRHLPTSEEAKKLFKRYAQEL